MLLDQSIIRVAKAIKITVVTFFKSPVKTFVLLAGIFGLLIVFLTPPLTGADEEAHFVRAYGIVQGDLRLYNTNKVEMPKSYRQTIGCLQTGAPVAGKTYTYHFEGYGQQGNHSGLKCALDLELRSGETEKVRTSAGSYSPTTYIPQVIAITIGRFFEVPIVVMVYLVRLSVLLAYILLIVFALKLLPVRKWALVGVALLPHSINQITNPGGDYLLLGAVAVLVAVVVRSIYVNSEILKKENKTLLIILCVTSCLLVMAKGPFPGIVFLPLIVFYGGLRYEKVKKAAIIFLALIVAYLWYTYGASAVTPWRETTHAISVLSFPQAFFQTMFFKWVDADFIQIGQGVTVGNHLGMPSIAITITNILLAIYLFVSHPEKKQPTISTRQLKLLTYTTFILALAVVVGSFAALYVGASYLQKDVGNVIYGVQARYFYPAFFAVALLPIARSFSAKNTSVYVRAVIVGSVLLLITNTLLQAAYYV